MSAIWGCIDFSGSPIEKELPKKMSQCTNKYRIDRIDYLQEDNVYMACGLQYITKESYNEKLPYQQAGVYFTADCMLDDRDNLIRELGNGVAADTPDGKLLFMAFKKWGESFGDHVLGVFSFAVYDRNKNEFHLYTDHTSSRCIHYHKRGSRIYFSTLTSAITDAFPDIGLCEKWMYGCEATDFSFSFMFEGLTPFEGVYIIPYGSGIVAKTMGNELTVTARRYWDPIRDVKDEKRFDDAKHREEFIKTHVAAVKDAIRTDGEVGVLLSGGLDSTSIASVAATLLAKENKEVKSFTSIPLKEFRESYKSKNAYFINDESHLVLRLCNKYQNIKPEFLACEGKSPWTFLENWNDIMEIPGKGYVNHVWIHEAYNRAREKGCKIVMGGFWGNNTISYGCMEETAYKEITSGHPASGINELMGYAKKEHFSRKRYLKHFIRMCKNAREKLNFDGLFSNDTLKEQVINEDGVKQAWEELLSEGGGVFKSKIQKRRFIINDRYFQLMGVMCTKYGLYHGIVVRDPSADKRMLELCLKLPYKCFASDGNERRLIREYLKDYIPDEIRCEVIRRGRQSGDASIRFEKFVFPDGKMPWEKITDKIEKYYHKDKVIKLLQDKRGENLDWQIKVVSCNLFLEKYEK